MSYPAQEYSDAFLNHRQPLLELLEKIPDDQSHFTIYNGGLSLVNQINQLLGFDNSVLEALTQQTQPAPNYTALSNALAHLKINTPQIAELLAALPKTNLDANLTIEGETRKIYQWLDFVREHEIHHKGQLWMAARMLKIEPPYYIKMES